VQKQPQLEHQKGKTMRLLISWHFPGLALARVASMVVATATVPTPARANGQVQLTGRLARSRVRFHRVNLDPCAAAQTAARHQPPCVPHRPVLSSRLYISRPRSPRPLHANPCGGSLGFRRTLNSRSYIFWVRPILGNGIPAALIRRLYQPIITRRSPDLPNPNAKPLRLCTHALSYGRNA